MFIISPKQNLFSPWYSWTIPQLVLRNNHILIHFRYQKGVPMVVTLFLTYTVLMYGQRLVVVERHICTWASTIVMCQKCATILGFNLPFLDLGRIQNVNVRTGCSRATYTTSTIVLCQNSKIHLPIKTLLVL